MMLPTSPAAWPLTPSGKDVLVDHESEPGKYTSFFALFVGGVAPPRT
jgi:hypothetical protein